MAGAAQAHSNAPEARAADAAGHRGPSFIHRNALAGAGMTPGRVVDRSRDDARPGKLDRASVRALAGQRGGTPLFLVPFGLKAWLARLGIARAVELDWWDVHVPDGASVRIVN